MRAPPQVPEFPCLDELGPCANSEPTIAIGGLTCLGRPGLGHMICHVGERDWGGRVSLSCMRAESCLTLRPCGLWPTRVLCLWDFPGKNTGVGCHCLLRNSTLDSIYSIRVSVMQLAFTWLVVKSVMKVLFRSYVFYAYNFSRQGSQNSRSRITNLQQERKSPLFTAAWAAEALLTVLNSS